MSMIIISNMSLDEEINRSKKREELLNARRFEGGTVPQGLKVDNLPQMVRDIWLDEGKSQLLATRQYRLLLSSDLCPPIDDVLKGQIVPRLIQFLECENSKQLRMESALALADIGCERPNLLVDYIPVFVNLLSSPSCEIMELAVCILGNLALHFPSYRDQILKYGALDPLLAQLNKALGQVIEQPLKFSMLKEGSITLSNLLRGKPPLHFDQIQPVLPLLKRLIDLSDEEVISDACWALLYLSDGANDKIQAVVDAGICPRLFQLLDQNSSSVLHPALLTIANIVKGNENQCEIFVNHVLPLVYNILFGAYDVGVKRSASKIVAIITGTNANYIQSVIDAGIVIPLVMMVSTKTLEEAGHAAMALSSMASKANYDQVWYLVEAGCLKFFCHKLLDSPYSSIVGPALEGIENILNKGEDSQEFLYNCYVVKFTAEWIDKLYNLHGHDNDVISTRARYITNKYWWMVLRGPADAIQ